MLLNTMIDLVMMLMPQKNEREKEKKIKRHVYFYFVRKDIFENRYDKLKSRGH